MGQFDMQTLAAAGGKLHPPAGVSNGDDGIRRFATPAAVAHIVFSHSRLS